MPGAARSRQALIPKALIHPAPRADSGHSVVEDTSCGRSTLPMPMDESVISIPGNSAGHVTAGVLRGLVPGVPIVQATQARSENHDRNRCRPLTDWTSVRPIFFKAS